MENWCCNVLFCTNEARAFQPMGAMLSGLCDAVPGRLTGHWLGLGRFDHILVTLAKEPELLLKPEREVQSCPHASSHWACFGRVVAASFDLEAEAWPEDQGVVVGVCGIKLAHALRDESPELEPIAKALERRLEAIHEEEGMTGPKGQWLISSTTGWEDMVLIYWTHDFSTLSKVMGKVRSLGMSEIEPAVRCEGVHATLTTCTLAGIHLPAGSFVREEKRFDHESWVKMVSPRLKAGTELDWAVRFELRPGHFDPFCTELKERFEGLPGYKAATVSYRNVMGQYDFRVQQQRGNQGGWLDFMGNVALPLTAKEHSLARSMETHLYIEVPQFSEDSAAAAKVERHMPGQNGERNELKLIETACKASAIAPHTVEVLQATHTRLMALLEDDLQHGTFTSVESLFVRLAEGLSSKPEGIAELDRSFFSWLSAVERCLADRYRGTYPLGEAVVPRLGTYQASHHGFLTAMDCIGQHAFDYALASMNGLTAPGARVPEMAVCCFIGSSPSPYALSLPLYMRSGFIELPAIMIFQLRELPVLLHEVGHLFVNAVCAHHGIVYHKEGLELRTLEKVKTAVQEILAEMFACCACYQGDVGRYGENRDQILQSYLPQNNRFTSSTLLISMVRLYAVHWLIGDELGKHATPQAAQTKFRSDALAMIKEDLKSHADAAQAATLQGEAEMAATIISYAMEVFARSRMHQPAHEQMLQAIRSLGETKNGKPGRLAEKSREADTLERVKEFAALKTSELAADFGFIEKMVSWAAEKSGGR